jgi:hypothetical protein
MSKMIFSVKSFSALVRAGDAKQFDVNLKQSGSAIIADASKQALAGAIDLLTYKTTTLRSKLCVSYKNYAAILLLRSLTRFLSKKIGISLPSRDRIVRGVIETLLDGTPIHAIRKDISSFYENISVAPLKRRVMYDVPASVQMRDYLKTYFSAHCSKGPNGLPRGIGLSALLAEISMKDFDSKVKSIPGVYKYYRYSDDILIFSTRPGVEIDVAIANALPSGMQFNTRKCSEIFFPGKSFNGQSPQPLEYLGYCFTTKQRNDKKDSRIVRVGISSRKIAKLKTRIILSLMAHARHPNYLLLRDRCRFLTCNFRVRRNGADVVKFGTHVFSGIFYNYKMAGTYAVKSGKLHADNYDGAELKALDGFYHSILCKQTASATIKLNHLQLIQLRSFSFWQGFSRRIKWRFSADRVAFIKRAWRNA